MNKSEIAISELMKLEARQWRDSSGKEIKGALWVRRDDVAGLFNRSPWISVKEKLPGKMVPVLPPELKRENFDLMCGACKLRLGNHLGYECPGRRGTFFELESGAAQEVSPSANFVSEIRPRPDDPSCHVCGAQMVAKEWKCLSCKATTGVEEVSPPSQEPGFDEATEARWQKAIYEACKKVLDHSLRHLIDGAGCDSGDALNFTLTEIRQTFNILQNPEAEGDTRELKAALKALVDKLKIILPKVDGFIGLASLRAGQDLYDGPNIVEELKEAERLLG